MDGPDRSERASVTDPGLPLRPTGRFNDWGQRKWITASEKKLNAVDCELQGLDLSVRTRALYRAARLVDSRGIEFVMVSNAQFPAVILVETGIHIVPCFLPLDPTNPQTEDRQAAMMRWGQFIYDGWVPIEEWTATKVESVVSALDDIVSLFSVVGGYFAYWEPKYPFPARMTPFHLASKRELQSLVRSLSTMDSLSAADREAIRRSLAWVANALRDDPVQRFLLLFVSIEALATYIEQDCDCDSPLRVFAGDRLSKRERKRVREACIEEVLQGEPELAEAVRTAYFKCVTGSRAMLEAHLNRVSGDSQYSDIVFREQVNGKTLWDLRNDIAHGSLNLLSEADVRSLSNRVGVLENLARSYLRAIFIRLTDGDYFARPRRPGFTIPLSRGTGAPGTDYSGPTDMAEYYANVEALSSSFVRVAPGR